MSKQRDRTRHSKRYSHANRQIPWHFDRHPGSKAGEVAVKAAVERAGIPKKVLTR